MYLKSIDLKGFKSFPERTRLEFSPGVSVIVGPNGSGKSNITDAVLWALGEQSPGSIRGSSMQDVISSGGQGVGRRSEAEVEVVVDNESGGNEIEFSEISIRRRLTRDGEGEYRLNGARCRLADVIEVLADANLGRKMHSVISQGRVESIVNSKPRERRALVEEAAGLGKHRRRRRKAELKLRATRENLDRALDLEREARARLKPLKRQAEAAELGARLHRQEMEVRSRLVAEELRFGEGRLAEARRAATGARAERDRVQAALEDVRTEREAAEERFAQRDRERTRAWELVSGLRGHQEKLSVAHSGLRSLAGDFEARIERARTELGPLTLEVGEGGEVESARARRLFEELNRIGDALGRARSGLEGARAAEAPEEDRVAALEEVGDGADVAGLHARRARSLLGEERRRRAQQRLAESESVLASAHAAAAAIEAVTEAVRGRVAGAEERVLGRNDGGDEIAEELRRCSAREAELQGEMNRANEAVTSAEVEVAHLEDRRAEAAKQLDSIAKQLGEEIATPEEPLGDDERAEAERKLERLERRRSQIGPINPLAEREYEEARDHVSELESQRQDTERALRELEALISDIDSEIERSFEETFAATAENFAEMIEYLFPGGRGRLSRVALHPVNEDDSETSGDEEEREDREHGVEIEVTPAGKSMRRLSLLSGGEKSLVAIAFVFAVFLARPSPFYILDEVEAALDDANIDRFLKLLRRFSDRAQFVIVTHQKRTMDAADVLYGVTMGGDGVTRVVSRRLPREAGDEIQAADGTPGGEATRATEAA